MANICLSYDSLWQQFAKPPSIWYLMRANILIFYEVLNVCIESDYAQDVFVQNQLKKMK